MSNSLLTDRSLTPFIDYLNSFNARLNLSFSEILFVAGKLIKRTIDFVGASFLLALGLPVFLVVASLVAIDGGPVFFRHQRIGKNGRAFGCVKFRTMILGAEECLDEYLSYHPEAQVEWAKEQKLSFDPRVTSVGRFLRLSSLDELPQLFNVISGDMSLVGPRPVTQSELIHYGITAALYKSVRPGMTGLWQVSGRNNVGYDTRVRLDERYIRTWTLFNDFLILLQTPAVVISRRGAK